MGFFTDAYDLFIIGIVVDLLKPQWHLSTGQVSLLNSATLAAGVGRVFGALLTHPWVPEQTIRGHTPPPF